MAAFVDNRRQFNAEPRSGLISYGARSHLGRKVPDSIPIFELQPPRPRFESQAVQEDHEEEEKEEDDEDIVFWKLAEEEETSMDPRDAGTADEWVARNRSLVRLTGRHPFNSEAPLCRLMCHGFITPVSLHYVRNHGHVPRCGWDDWRVEVTGLVKKPTQFTMAQLVEEFRPRELPVTLVCAGNRRKEQNMVKQTIGFNWGAAGISTSVWKGVRLVDLLRRCGIMSKKEGALFVCFEGAEDLPGGGGGKYGTSVTVDVAMDAARDVIVAYRQNGQLLQPDHGFPVRVIIPGFIGGRMVKWLRRICVSSAQSDSYYHKRDNKVLPSHVDADSALSQGWWNKPEYIINELNINSVITTPSHEEILPINSSTTQKPYTLKGYAYSGGGRKVIRVEVTLDGGETWKFCSVTHPEKPTKFGKHWCWCFWELDVEVMELLNAKEIAVRAWDESMNTQPKDLTWNLMGMMNNCWFRVKRNVCMPHHGELGLVFEHPTRPGNQPGGWMAREKLLEDTQQQANHTLKKSSSAPIMNTASKNITLSEVQKHNTKESAWIIVHSHVYDCTIFLKDHPGGMDSILINAGSDCTEEFDAIHSSKAKAILEGYRIGELLSSSSSSSSCETSPDNSMHGANRAFTALSLAPITELPISKQDDDDDSKMISKMQELSKMTRPVPQDDSDNKMIAKIQELSKTTPRALNQKQYITCKLIAKKAISHDVRLFRFALPNPDQTLGLPAGKHIFVSSYIDNKLCMRAYTPVSSDDEVGHFELLVKIYFKGVHPKFLDGGLMSQHLDSMALGESIRVKGPVGHIQYHGQGKFTINGDTKLCKTISMVGGGTGITPLYQVIKAVLKDPMDETCIHLVYANRTENDILLREELDQMAEQHSNFKVWYVINKSVKEGWNYSLGSINEEILRDHLPDGSSPETLALMCGPPLMIQLACLPNLAKSHYDVNNSCFQF